MSRLRYLNPFRIAEAVRTVRRVSRGGRPRRLRLVGVGPPEGLLVPTSTVTLEVEGKGGHTERFRPVIPIPFTYAWGFRALRRLLAGGR